MSAHTAGMEFATLLSEIEERLDADVPPVPEELRRDASALRAIGERLSGLASKIDDLATLREFSERVALRRVK